MRNIISGQFPEKNFGKINTVTILIWNTVIIFHFLSFTAFTVTSPIWLIKKLPMKLWNPPSLKPHNLFCPFWYEPPCIWSILTWNTLYFNFIIGFTASTATYPIWRLKNYQWKFKILRLFDPIIYFAHFDMNHPAFYPFWHETPCTLV